MRRQISIIVAAHCFALLLASTTQAAFHLWQVKEIFSNHDGTVQFIELFDSFSSEQFVGGKVLRATSDGVIKNFTIPSNLVVPTGQSSANKHMLIATPGFSALTGGVTPDFTLPDPIANGAFFNPNAASITITFVASGDAPVFSGTALPKDGVNSLTDANASGVPGNATNIGQTLNSPTNFAGAAGSVNVPPPPTTTGDYNGDLHVDAADYTVWRDTVGAAVLAGSGADGDGDGTIDDGDYEFWKTRFGNAVPPGAASATAAIVVPEPTIASLAMGGIVALALVAIRERE